MRAYSVVAVAALAAGLAACGRGGSGASAETVVSVTLGASDLALVQTTTLRSGVPLSGALEPKVTVEVGAPIAEQLLEVFVNEGDAVRAGEPLVRFRDDVLKAAAASARADLATARMQASVAVQESTRAQTLLAEGAISPRDRDNALVGLEQARARQALTEATLANAQDRLENSTVKSPISGVVSKRWAQAGDRVDFGKPVITIVNTSVLQLEASVDARWAMSLRVGRPVALTVANMEHDTIVGRISRINPTADAATRQVRIYVDVPNPGRLVGGLFVSGRALLEEVRGALAVPQPAVRLEGEARTPVVYVVKGDRVARRTVALGVEDPDRGLVQITRGLQAGERVIVGPVDRLADGTRVEITGPSPAPTPAGR
jgi:RND family efflux transporter MFP subunit